ncbi:MAG TPA: ROK family transcriptional regulator [Pseudonocardiaceae bacterium]|nr:ROK family transcriptional regulator [Pseudonocardiaceae bacterium]
MSETGVNLRGLRRHNRSLLLTAIRRSGGLSRVELAARSGLTQQAVSKIVPDLLDAGLVEERREPASGVGKPRTRLVIRADARAAIGVQLDRDEVRAVRTDLLGRVVDTVRAPLPPGFDPTCAVRVIKQCVAELSSGVERAALVGVGVGALGPLDFRTGIVLGATGLTGWDAVPLRELLGIALRAPVIVDKDTNAAAFAHLWRADDDAATAVVLVGTGLGAGLLIANTVYRGPGTNAGEFGHTTLLHDGPVCRCGRRGCLEILHDTAPTPREAARLLGIALADLVQLLDLERIVLAGRAVWAAPDTYRREAIAQLGLLPTRQRVQVDIDDIGIDLVALGAAAEVLAEFYAADSYT